ncbi:Npun_F0296 family exosortase-dependent surface protein [Elioraea rosea]|uniref:Npun_F0296 family exosortase-dependent surface protein n=1 Tax=Elioraea rosea TaxID=2492390 RepID=UPI001183050F|nr:hypothetical protein [Elioraea rosea]
MLTMTRLGGVVRAMAVAIGLGACGPALAAVTISETPNGSPAPSLTMRDNLDWLALGAVGGTSPVSGIVVTLFGGAAAVTGSSDGRYAAPFLTGQNGEGFGAGGSRQRSGVDATTYLTTGSTLAQRDARAEIILPYLTLDLGLLWGSVDDHNALALFAGDTLVGTVRGGDVIAGASGNQGPQGTRYINIRSDAAFDRLVASSAGYAFEFDNIAFGPAVAIAAPAALGVFVVGVLGLAAVRLRFR